MKTAAIIILSACLAAVVAIGFTSRIGRPAKTEPVPNSTVSESETTPQVATAASAKTQLQPKQRNEGNEPAADTTPSRNSSGTSQPAPGPAASPVFSQAIDSLVSPQVTYLQKQEAWKHLRDSGKLDQAMVELERRGAAEPTSAAYPAALGQACLQKAGTIQDIREQGILGMKADQSFEAALNIDPSNWEARFWKATAMSYWPPQLNKGKEVLEQYLELVRQQEVQPSQPHFAQTYVFLGDQYMKQGHPEYAKEVWQRGLSLFPSDTSLQQKMTPSETAQQN